MKVTWIDCKVKMLAVWDFIDAHPWPSACAALFVAGVMLGLLL